MPGTNAEGDKEKTERMRIAFVEQAERLDITLADNRMLRQRLKVPNPAFQFWNAGVATLHYLFEG